MGGRVGEGACIQQEPSARLDDVCDGVKARGIAHCAFDGSSEVKEDVRILLG